MVRLRELSRWCLSTGLGVSLNLALAFGWVLPVNAAQAPDAEPSMQPALTEPAPLIMVRPLPFLPPPPPPRPEEASTEPLPALYSEPVGPFVMYMETIASGPSQYGLITSPGCVLDSIFKRGMKMVWRFEVYDLASGMRLTDRAGAHAQIRLADGTVRESFFEVRGGGPNVAPPPGAPWTWVSTWDIPLDYPLGPIEYSVNITSGDGRSATLMPSSLGAKLPMVVD